MTTEPNQGSIHALSGAYVVDAVDDAERAAFEAHLDACPDCRAEVLGLREATALLAHDAALAPPDSLRAGVLAGIRTIRPLPPHTGASVVALRPRRRFRLGTLAVAAAVLAILGIAAVAQPWRSADTPPASAVDKVLTADDATHVKVAFPDGSTATVFRSVSEKKAALVTQDMAPAPDGKVYEVWLLNPQGRMVPAGLMGGRGDHRMLLKGDAATSTAAAISVEPAGGSEAPTSEPIATFDFGRA